MYSVQKKKHERYGNVIEIIREDSDKYITPFQAVNQARSIRRTWIEEGATKVKILIDGQVLTLPQMESWAIKEYNSLPKCEECGKILGGDVFTHSLSGDKLFCTQTCADKNYSFVLERFNDNEESEYDCL